MNRQNKSLILKNCLTRLKPIIGMTTVIVLSALPSQANWYLDHYEASGSNSAPEILWAINETWPSPGAVYNGWWSPGSIIGVGGTVSSAGTVTAVFKWNGSSPFPGGKVGIRIQSEASGTAKPEVGLSLNPGTKLIPQQPADQESDGSPGQYQKIRLGKQLFNKQVDAGATEVRQQISISSIAAANAEDGASVYVAASAVYDPRLVTITRGGAPTAKKESDTTLNKDIDEWIDANGNGYGHSTYSYWIKSVDMEGTPYYNYFPNIQQFHAAYSFPGTTGQGWQSIQSWQWVPSETDPADTYDSHTQEMPYGDMFHFSGSSNWEGTAKAKSDKVISYSVTDADGATAEAKYKLTLHDPYERKTHNVVMNQQSNVRKHPYAVVAKCSVPNESVTVSCSYTATWSVTGAFSGTLSDWMAKNLGFGASIGMSYAVSSGTSNSHSVSDMAVGESTYLEIFDLHDVHSGLADKWTSSGYGGEENYEFKVPSSVPGGTQLHFPYDNVTPPPGNGG